MQTTMRIAANAMMIMSTNAIQLKDSGTNSADVNDKSYLDENVWVLGIDAVVKISFALLNLALEENVLMASCPRDEKVWLLPVGTIPALLLITARPL